MCEVNCEQDVGLYLTVKDGLTPHPIMQFEKWGPKGNFTDQLRVFILSTYYIYKSCISNL